jgi:hypothetical protein
MNMKIVALLGVAILPGIVSAGAIVIGSSTSQITFNGTAITLGTCAGTCTVSGTGSVKVAPTTTVPLQWSIVTTLNGGVSVQETGVGPTFAINQEGATALFSLTDGVDSLAGSLAFTSATDSGSPSKDVTDIDGTVTFTSVNLTNAALQAYFLANYGPLPKVGGTSVLDLTVSCGNTTVCIAQVDPTGTVTGASISPASTTTSSAVPEPGTLVLCGGAFVALFYRLRRRGAK